MDDLDAELRGALASGCCDSGLLEKLEAHCRALMDQARWGDAVQAQVQAAQLAYRCGQTGLFREYSRQAIDTAGSHNLPNAELNARLLRFDYLLRSDLSGQSLDELNAELCEKPGTMGSELAGALVEKLDFCANAACVAFDMALASLANPTIPLAEAVAPAREKATAFSLNTVLDGLLELAAKPDANLVTLREDLRNAVECARSETSRNCDVLRVDMFVLLASLRRKLNAWDAAKLILQAAEAFAQPMPLKLWKVETEFVGLFEDRNQFDAAEAHARQAVDAAEKVGAAMLIDLARANLRDLQARAKDGGFHALDSDGSGAGDLLKRFEENAARALLAGNFEGIVNAAGELLKEGVSATDRRAVLRVRMVALFDLQRFREAEADLEECLSLLSAEIATDATAEAVALDSRVKEKENLCQVKAFFRAKEGKAGEAWDIAEEGRSIRLKKAIAKAGESSDTLQSGATFGGMREWLRSNRVAIVSFTTCRWGTLVLTSGPDDAEPQADILEFHGKDLTLLLGGDDQLDSATWNDRIHDAIPTLSKAIVHPVAGRWRAIAKSARVLYVIPESLLYYAPFAGMTLEDSPESELLIDLCPLSFVPSLAALRWVASRRQSRTAPDCLAVACGKDSTGFEFRDHLAQIARAPWPSPLTLLSDNAASLQAVAEEASSRSVLYFSCHGAVSGGTQDVMAASQLKLAGESILTASDVAGWKLCASLVFLNACQSGRFRLAERGDVNGFVRGFLLAGASSVVAPSIQVNPKAAGDFAEGFFTAWLTGAGVAEALRTAQLAARERNPDSREWATYSLTGDFV